MKLIYLTSRFPYPINKGDKLRSFNQIKQLSSSCDIYLISLSDKLVKSSDVEQLKNYCKEIYIYQISFFTRTLNLLKTLINNRPFQVNYFYCSSIQKKIDENISRIKPDHIFCQLVRTALYVKDNHSIPKTLDYMDALSKGLERRIQISNFLERPFVKIEYKRMKQFENLAFEFFDKKIIISKSDRNQITHIDHSKIKIIPNGIDTEFYKNIKIQKNYDLIFIGNLSYRPNIEAALYIANKIYPIIKKKLPNIKIHIAGSNPNKRILRLANEGIKVSGWVEDVRKTYCSGKVFFAPMTIGSGLQNKLLEAMSLSIPCITSKLCNESLMGKNMENIIIGNSIEDYIKKIIQTLNDVKLRDRIGNSGRKYVVENFSWESSNKALIKILSDKQSS